MRIKISVLAAFFCLCSSSSFAQNVRETLEGVKSISFQKGVLVYGFRSDDEIGHSFVATLYDGALNEKAKYVKKIPGDVNILWSYCIPMGDHLDIYVKAAPLAVFIKLSSDLKEISFTELDDVARATDKPIIKEKSAIYPASINAPFINPLELTTGIYFRNQKHERFLKNDYFEYDLKKQEFIRWTPLSGLKADTHFTPIWGTALEGFKKIKSTGTFYLDDQTMMASFISKGKNTFWDDYVVSLDVKTGAVRFVTQIIYPDPSEEFFLVRSSYDPETEKTIVIGQLFKAKGKTKMHATAIMVYDKRGELVRSNAIEFPVLTETEKLPKFVDWNDNSIVVLGIEKVAKGKYFVITEFECQVTPDGLPINKVAGYSYYELNDAGVVSNEKFQPFLQYKTTVSYPEYDKMGRFVFLTARDKKELVLGTISFTGGNSEFKELERIDYIPDPTHNYNPNYDTDIYRDFILDGKNVISFHKHAKSNIYDLKTQTVK